MDLLISELNVLSNPSETPQEVFRRFAACIRLAHAGCGLVVISAHHLSTGTAAITGYCGCNGEVFFESSRLFEASAGIPIRNPTFLNQLLSCKEPTIVERFDIGTPELAQTSVAQNQNALVLPLFLDGKQENWLALINPNLERLKQIDTTHALLLANLVAAYTARIADTRRLQEANTWIERELDEIVNIQNSLLPQAHPAIQGIDTASSYKTFDRAGGDYYDIMALRRNLGEELPPHAGDVWGVIVADVAGHGPAAAVEAAMLDAILRTYPGPVSNGPAQVLAYANRFMFTRQVRKTFITAFAANYYPHKSTLVYANAGHPAPLLRRRSDSMPAIEYLDTAVGIPLGVTKDYCWENIHLPMSRGDSLVIYTDGVTDAMSPTGEQFSLGRLEHAVSSKDSPEQIVSAIEHAMRQHLSGNKPQDDQTLLVIQLCN